MKYYICPKCACVNESTNVKCAGCGLLALAIMVMPNLRWLQFNSTRELDDWIRLMKRVGSTVWRKQEVK